jgi:hypothetical protein
MNFGSLFSSAFNAVASFFHIANTAPAVLAQSADNIVSEASGVIDSIGGTGTAAKITGDIDDAKQAAINLITPHLQQAEMAETLVQGVATILTASAVKSAQTTATSDVSGASGAAGAQPAA